MSDVNTIEALRAAIKRRGWKSWRTRGSSGGRGTAWKFSSASGAHITIKGDHRNVLITVSLIEEMGL